MIVGIDPGLTGAIAFVHGDECVEVQDMPVVDKPTGKGRWVDVPTLADILAVTSWLEYAWYDYPVVIERVRAMPPKTAGKVRSAGTQSSFNFGETAGVIRAVVTVSGRDYAYVEAAAWKRRAGLIGLPKEAAIEQAMAELRGAERYLTIKRGVTNKGQALGRADAMLIAKYGCPLFLDNSRDMF